jgi:hypothetical protein
MDQKKPAKNARPPRSLAELLEESRRLDRRGRELVEQVKALSSEVAEARSRSGNGGAKPKMTSGLVYAPDARWDAPERPEKASMDLVHPLEVRSHSRSAAALIP